MNSDTSTAHRPSWAGMIHSGQQVLAETWDAAWGLVLLAVAGIAHVLRTRSEVISYGVLFFLVAGTAAFTRDFSKLRVGPLYITEMCLAALAITLGSLLGRRQISLFPAAQTARWILFLIFAYLSFGTLRLGLEFARGASAGVLAMLRNFALVYYAAFAIIGWLVLQRAEARARLRYILAAAVIFSTLTSLWTVIVYAVDPRSLMNRADFDPTAVIQGQAVVFAIFSVLIVANMLRYGAMPRNPLLRVTVVAVLLLNVLYIYLSGHRSALVGCAAGLVMMMVASSRTGLGRRIRWRWVAVALGSAVAVWYFLAGYLVDFALKFQTLLSPLEETNAAWRAAYWFAVGLLWLTSPVIGVGFGHDFYEEDPLRLVQAEHYDPHNSYLAILARTGIVGLLLMAVASLLFVRLLIKLVRQSSSGDTVVLAGCLLSCFAAIAAFAAANVTLESPYHALFFWLFIGFGIALAEREVSVAAGAA